MPAHFDAEVLSAIQGMVRRGVLEAGRADVALYRLMLLPFERRTLSPLVRRAFALRDRFSAADGLYVVLAQRLGATLVTVDGRLARACQGLLAVELVAL